MVFLLQLLIQLLFLLLLLLLMMKVTARMNRAYEWNYKIKWSENSHSVCIISQMEANCFAIVTAHSAHVSIFFTTRSLGFVADSSTLFMLFVFFCLSLQVVCTLIHVHHNCKMQASKQHARER